MPADPVALSGRVRAVLGSPQGAQSLAGAVHAGDECRVKVAEQRQTKCGGGFRVGVAWAGAEEVANRNDLGHVISLSQRNFWMARSHPMPRRLVQLLHDAVPAIWRN